MVKKALDLGLSTRSNVKGMVMKDVGRTLRRSKITNVMV